MFRIFVILFSSILSFSLSILGVFADEVNPTPPEKAVHSIEIDASGAISGDPSGIAIESIKDTAATYPDSPAAIAAKSISPVLSDSLAKESINLPNSLARFFAYLSFFLGVLSLLGFTIGSIFFKGDEEKAKIYRSCIRKISIVLTISFASSLILYFIIPLVFR